MCFFIFGNDKSETKKKRLYDKTQTKAQSKLVTQNTMPTSINTTRRTKSTLITTGTKGGTLMQQPTQHSERTGPMLDENVAHAMMEFVDATVHKGIVGLKKEYEKIGPSKVQASVAFKENSLKNRYGNIPCFDFNRVVLSYQSPPESNYIHANRFESKIATLNTTFICTQAPIARTINDFWRMVWQEKPKFIVMLCRLFENNKPKCAVYWPVTRGTTETYGKVSVTNEGDGGKGFEQVFDIENFRVCADNREIIVKHIRWLDWPDFGIPTSGLGMLRVLRKLEKGTAIVHCSAGIGRTGTLLAAEVTMKALTSGKHVKTPEVVRELRAQRYGMIQTSSQYVYLHFSILTYCERKLHSFPEAKGHLNKLKDFFAAYKKFANREEIEDRKLVKEGFDVRNATNARK